MRTTSFRDYVAGKTLKIRHSLVNLLAPHIAYSLRREQIMHNYIVKTPRPMVLEAKKHFVGGDF